MPDPDYDIGYMAELLGRQIADLRAQQADPMLSDTEFAAIEDRARSLERKAERERPSA